MKATIKFFIVAGFAFFMGMGSVGAQGWERFYKFGDWNDAYTITQTPDSSYWVGGVNESIKGVGGGVLTKLDKNGNAQFHKQMDLKNNLIFEISPTSDNGVLALINRNQDLVRLDKNGKILWSKNLLSNYSGYKAQELKTNDILLFNNTISGVEDIKLLDKNGVEIWTKKLSDTLSFNNLEVISDSKFVISAIGKKGAILVELEYDYSGNLLTQKDIFLNESGIRGILRFNDSTYFFVSYKQFKDYTAHNLSKIVNQKLIWNKEIFRSKDINNYYKANSILDKNGNIVICGINYSNKSEIKSNGFIMVLDNNGTVKSFENYGGDYVNDFSGLMESNDGYYVACGWNDKFSQGGNPIIYYSSVRVVKTKADKLSNKIFGKIAIDKNSNCKADSLEKKYSSITLNAKNVKKESNYAFVDSEGNYQIFADTGKYTVKATMPSPYFKQICDSTITLTNTLNTTPLDILLQKTVSCPYLSADISTQGFRPCVSSVQTIKYCNQGSESAKNAYVSLMLDPNLTYETSSIPAALQANGTYKFALGNVPFDTCATFTITTKTKCDNTLTGKTLCNKVHIYPDSLCIINDNAKVQVAGNCTGTKIDFNIKNFGQANMIAAKNYLIIEDDVMFKQGTFNLGAGQTLPISITPKAGKTYRIIAEQTDATLGAIATTAFEACVPSANSSTGFINQFSLGDDSPFEDEDCRVVVNSFDPNDKQGFPTGIRTQHFIPKNTDIEYLIRFQNTGTDTAFVVVLKDTLSAFLDPATIQPGASSHAYKFDLTDNGIAKFAFYNINLPHEKANKDGSNGFVKFRIKQRANNPNGTIIKNRAGIYFDYNDPIITNTTTHTIDENWLQIVPTQEPNVSNVVVKVFPNPFNESTRIEVQTEDYKNLIFSLLDINGKVIRSEKFDGNSLDFSRNDLLGGFYLYQIQSEGKVLQSGKLVVQ